MRQIPVLQVLSGGGSLAQPQADEIRERALAVLLCSYRKADADAADVYVEALACVLRRYTIEIVREVCDPAGAFRCSQKFVPDVAELNAACEAADARNRRREERDRRIKQQLEERKRIERESANRPAAGEVTAQLRERGLQVLQRIAGHQVGPADVDWSI